MQARSLIPTMGIRILLGIRSVGSLPVSQVARKVRHFFSQDALNENEMLQRGDGIAETEASDGVRAIAYLSV